MATILRVKRRNDEEPLDLFYLAGKKRKIEGDEGEEEVTSNEPLKTVVKFAGTLQNQEEDVIEHIRKTLQKDELTANYKQHVVSITDKARAKFKQESRDQRYKVVNHYRSVDTVSSKHDDESVMTVINVESATTGAADKASDSAQEVEYVYDLYYAEMEEHFNFIDEWWIQSFEQELVLDTYREGGERFEDDCESEDSNSESNMKNDYPDSDHSDNSIRDAQMTAAMRDFEQSMKIFDLSSDEDFVYAMDEGDVDAYGYKYAKYKARILEEHDGSDSNEEFSSARDGDEESEDDGDKHETEEED